jgi:hypothetical protein
MKEIALTKDKIALIDDEDFEKINNFTWHWSGDPINPERAGYAMSANNIAMHRLILNLGKNDPHVDHKDGNGLDNRRNNLRLATRSQNGANKRKNRNKVSKFKGVSPCSSNKTKWRATIKVNKKTISLGTYLIEEMAAYAYDLAAKKYFGEFALVNNVPEIPLKPCTLIKKECKNGHSKFVIYGNRKVCVQCSRIKSNKYKQKRKNKIKE